MLANVIILELVRTRSCMLWSGPKTMQESSSPGTSSTLRWAQRLVCGADTATGADAAVAEAAADQSNKINAAKDAIVDAQKLHELT